MAPKEISLTRALAEIKFITKRIVNADLSKIQLVDISVGGRMSMSENIEKLTSAAKSNIDQYNDLITLRNRLKSAIIKANGTVLVEIAGTQMTIAEAIDRKAFAASERSFYVGVMQNILRAYKTFEATRVKVIGELNQKIESVIGRDTNKNSPDVAVEVDSITKLFLKNNEVKFEDPMDAKTKIEAKIDAIDAFLNEVDFTLSEINARTMIVLE